MAWPIIVLLTGQDETAAKSDKDPSCGDELMQAHTRLCCCSTLLDPIWLSVLVDDRHCTTQGTL